MKFDMENAKKYLHSASDEKVGIEEYGEATIPGAPGVSLTDTADKAGKYGLEHADGTPCDAKTPDSCPHNKKAQRADDLRGHEGRPHDDGLSEEDRDAIAGAKKSLVERADDISSEIDRMMDLFEDGGGMNRKFDTSALYGKCVNGDHLETVEKELEIRDEYFDIYNKLKELREKALGIRKAS